MLSRNGGAESPDPPAVFAGRTRGCRSRPGGTKFRFRKAGRTPRTPGIAVGAEKNGEGNLFSFRFC